MENRKRIKLSTEKEIVACPYLDTIQRQRLDFDNEKTCSVTLSPLNVYACLVCGKYFQGRGPSSVAHLHSIEEGHHVYINLETLKFYCLPDGYEVIDHSLNDIKFVIIPQYQLKDIQALDEICRAKVDLNDKKYIPGFMGINNIKANDYVNVIVQSLAHVRDFRNHFVTTNFDTKKPLSKALSDCIRKLWNPKAFKAHHSPHELMAIIREASEKRFHSTVQSDPLSFLTWLLNAIHVQTKKKGDSIISECFRGIVRVKTIPIIDSATAIDDPFAPQESDVQIPFFFLGLELPEAPLYQDELERNIIPQVPLATLLEKYNGEKRMENVDVRKLYIVTQLPKYLIISFKRFAKNNWTKEKNPTIVNFPTENMEFPYLAEDGTRKYALYDLVANVSHDESGSSSYKVHVHHPANGQWFEIQDLDVKQIMPQMIFLSESYIQIWQQSEQK